MKLPNMSTTFFIYASSTKTKAEEVNNSPLENVTNGEHTSLERTGSSTQSSTALPSSTLQDLGHSMPISVDTWCERSGIPAQSVIKLLNKNGLPVLRLGSFRGAYPHHLSRVIDLEFKRQAQKGTEKRGGAAASVRNG